MRAGTLSFAAGETSKTFTVLVTNHDYDVGDVTVNLTLSGATGEGAIELETEVGP